MAATVAVALGVMAAAPASAATVDISSFVNADLRTYTNGFLYPVGPTSITIGGVGFKLAGSGSSGLGAIQSAVFGPPDSYVIPVGQTDVKTVYTVINSAFGAPGANIGSLTFTGLSNTFTYQLVEGANVRDHFNGGFVNTAPGVFATADFGPVAPFSNVRLDVQQIVLPVGFASDTLTSITFSGNGLGGAGAPFLAAATTVSGIPEAATWAMMIAGFGVMGLVLRRRGGALGQASL